MIGKSLICFASNVVATSARSVFRTGLNPATVTDSEISPSSSLMFSFVCVSTFTTISGKTCALKPASSAFTSYVPGSSRSLTYRPASFVTTLSAVLRSTLVIATVAPGTTAPVPSVTMPLTLP